VLGVKTLTSGQAALSTALLASGPRSLRAYYAGSTAYQTSTSAVLTQGVQALPSSGLQFGEKFAAPPYNQFSSSVAVGDFNGDGIADLAAIDAWA